MARKLNNSEKRRKNLREELFGDDSWDRVWKSSFERGFACLPRTLPIMLELAHDKAVTGNNQDCRTAYIELLCRDWGQAIVEILDEAAHAVRAGYPSQRGLRTWRERIRTLEDAGFIEVQASAARDLGYIMIRHPDRVISDLRGQRKVTDKLWLAYKETCREFGVTPSEDPLTAGPRSIVPKTAPPAVAAQKAAPAYSFSAEPEDDDIPF